MMLQSQNSDLSTNGLFGVIICHGYSTAASIAGAVNSLIGSYVFDSIDMPMETTVEEIRKTLEDKIRRINRFADVVILVDMGSLEQIAEAVQDRSVAIINNVSTKMALNIGYRIRGGTGIDEIFRDAESDYRIEYRVIRNKKKDSILFISESGLETAQRMADLFEDSLPRPIPAQLRAIPYERIQNGELQIAESENILFAACTEEVILPGITCIPLEGLITNSNLDTVKEKLNPYLSIQELNQLILNIRTNFTLVNVVQYLTILNPKTLLDYITAAVDALQRKRSVELEGGRLVGLYIHLSCLIERLVTKSGVLKNDAATEQFVKEHRDFIEDIRMSFRQITRHYHIEIPDSEMKYIYSFMHEQ
jgi:sigma-54 dependent transcriptional regulator of gfr operon